MVKSILSTKLANYQLVSIGIELVHKVLGGIECTPELMNNEHIAKANELALKWNEIFIESYVSTSGRGI